LIPLLLLSAAVAIAVGWCVTNLAWRTTAEFGGGVFLFRLCLSSGLGLGTCSVTYFLWISAFGRPSSYYIAVEVILALALIGLMFSRQKSRKLAAPCFRPSTPVRSNRFLVSAFSFSVVIGAAVFFLVSRRLPQGGFDAWTSWNLRARVLFRGGWHHWVEYARVTAAHHQIDTMHMDYPLLLPSNVARGWTYLGHETVRVPEMVAMLFTFATVGLLVSSLWLLRSRNQGLLAGLVLLGTPFFIRHGASQYADVPLAFFILATLVLFSLYDRAKANAGLLVLAGLSAGFAAWTKNEGLQFVLLILLILVAVVVVREGWGAYRRQMIPFAVGLLPVLLVVVFFKLQAPSFYLVTGARAEGLTATVHRLFDLSRYAVTGRWFMYELFEGSFGDWYINLLPILPFYALLLGRNREQDDSKSLITASVTLFLMVSGYFMVFIVSPDISVSITEHIAWALDRLLLQLWPSAIFALFLFINTPEWAAPLYAEKGELKAGTIQLSASDATVVAPRS
jgi:hypothetical protein